MMRSEGTGRKGCARVSEDDEFSAAISEIRLSRRLLFGRGGLAAAAAAFAGGCTRAAAPSASDEAPVPIPAQAQATEGFATLPDARLWYWDTGGDGEPIVLLHPNSGSGLTWPYQQPVFSGAGYRV